MKNGLLDMFDGGSITATTKEHRESLRSRIRKVDDMSAFARSSSEMMSLLQSCRSALDDADELERRLAATTAVAGEEVRAAE